MLRIRIQSSDGEILETDSAIAKCSKTIQRMLQNCGLEEEDDILIPVQNVRGAILRKVLEYAEHHKNDKEPLEDDENNANITAVSTASGTANKLADEITQWDANFLKVDQGTLFELISAANFLDAKGLLDVACKTVANMMRDKSPDEIRRTFNIKNDLGDEENERIRQENEWCKEK
ncbi:S-phase kinase-associated protein 1-like [Bradysia coprophila]|uniref:S-phase kinase-associated protein 1-like n=1 Tax=Bradysia coprophila TaxID=38358 RepID=UPI00187DBF8E|nr:S-phase kinase-associated protein 1-like [Bradysia coprophila]